MVLTTLTSYGLVQPMWRVEIIYSLGERSTSESKFVVRLQNILRALEDQFGRETGHSLHYRITRHVAVKTVFGV